MNTDDENIIEGKLSEIASGSESSDEVLQAIIAYMKQNDLKTVSIKRPEPFEEFMNVKVRLTLAESEDEITVEILE